MTPWFIYFKINANEVFALFIQTITTALVYDYGKICLLGQNIPTEVPLISNNYMKTKKTKMAALIARQNALSARHVAYTLTWTFVR